MTTPAPIPFSRKLSAITQVLGTPECKNFLTVTLWLLGKRLVEMGFKMKKLPREGRMLMGPDAVRTAATVSMTDPLPRLAFKLRLELIADIDQAGQLNCTITAHAEDGLPTLTTSLATLTLFTTSALQLVKPTTAELRASIHCQLLNAVNSMYALEFDLQANQFHCALEAALAR